MKTKNSESAPRSYSDVFNPKTFKVEDIWKMYAMAVMPNGASQVQHDETKNAFYAGFLECFKMFNDFASELEEAEAFELFNRLQIEANDFFETLFKRHAAKL